MLADQLSLVVLGDNWKRNKKQDKFRIKDISGNSNFILKYLSSIPYKHSLSFICKGKIGKLLCDKFRP